MSEFRPNSERRVPPPPESPIETVKPEPELIEETVEDEIQPEEEDLEPAPRAIDPAFVFIVLVIIALVGLNRIDVDVRYALTWSVLIVVAAFAIALDKIHIERITASSLFIGIGFGALIGLPVLGVGAAELKRISLSIFGNASDVSAFQMLAITMPLAEGLYYRAAMQSARSAVFTGIAGGVWSMVLFFPQLSVLKFPFVAAMIGLCFVFVNSVYSYLRHRFGLFSSWSCQITINLLLLFVARFAA